jgi:thiosulfate/3-mercaptopyruvate sulfurtransferase
MPHKTLISVEELAGHLDAPGWAVVDCRFSFADTEQGRRDYEQSHIAGAVYAHLDQDLSGPIVPGQTGRHPLPEPEALARRLGSWGIGPGVQVVAYDASGAGNAVRLWWLLRWLGHDAVAVLDGGWQAWLEQGRPVRSGPESRAPREFVARPRTEWVVNADEVDRLRADPAHLVVDSRSRERYRGDHEPIDPVAGHIPGAVCAPYTENLDANGRFLAPAALRARFTDLLGEVPAERSVFYCGSGVTAAHNLLALAHAGLGDGRLYAGSWSEWINDPQRPVGRGERA